MTVVDDETKAYGWLLDIASDENGVPNFDGSLVASYLLEDTSDLDFHICGAYAYQALEQPLAIGARGTLSIKGYAGNSRTLPCRRLGPEREIMDLVDIAVISTDEGDSAATTDDVTCFDIELETTSMTDDVKKIYEYAGGDRGETSVGSFWYNVTQEYQLAVLVGNTDTSKINNTIDDMVVTAENMKRAYIDELKDAAKRKRHAGILEVTAGVLGTIPGLAMVFDASAAILTEIAQSEFDTTEEEGNNLVSYLNNFDGNLKNNGVLGNSGKWRELVKYNSIEYGLAEVTAESMRTFLITQYRDVIFKHKVTDTEEIAQYLKAYVRAFIQQYLYNNKAVKLGEELMCAAHKAESQEDMAKVVDEAIAQNEPDVLKKARNILVYASAGMSGANGARFTDVYLKSKYFNSEYTSQTTGTLDYNNVRGMSPGEVSETDDLDVLAPAESYENAYLDLSYEEFMELELPEDNLQPLSQDGLDMLVAANSKEAAMTETSEIVTTADVIVDAEGGVSLMVCLSTLASGIGTALAVLGAAVNFAAGTVSILMADYESKEADEISETLEGYIGNMSSELKNYYSSIAAAAKSEANQETTSFSS